MLFLEITHSSRNPLESDDFTYIYSWIWGTITGDTSYVNGGMQFHFWGSRFPLSLTHSQTLKMNTELKVKSIPMSAIEL